MSSWLKRQRNRRGFGVHSPFAFDFITNTLRSLRGYAYYCYGQLSRRERLLLRILVRLKPRTVLIETESSDRLARIVELAGCGAMVNGPADRYDLAIVIDKDSRNNVNNAAAAGSLIILPPFSAASEALWQAKTACRPNGMTFTSSNYKIFVADTKLPRQDFEL